MAVTTPRAAASTACPVPRDWARIIPFSSVTAESWQSRAAIRRAAEEHPHFRATASDFSVQNARFLCELSLAAYETRESKVRRELAERSVTDCRLLDCTDSDTQALVGRAGRGIFVAFRGTEPSRVRDVMTNVNLQFVPGPMGHVHSGFLASLEAIWEKLLDAVASRQDGQRHLWITGHSLGGALAKLTVARLVRMRRPVQGLYTYGAPRCGDARFASEYDRQARHYSFRIVNEQDVVPKVAPRFLGYEHAGRHCLLDGNGSLAIDSQPSGDLVNSLTDAFAAIFDGEDDHSLAQGYLPKLAALAPQERPVLRVA
ncbi:MAG TPA: lipase family protein [Pirellulaceae bacterium]|nr:lipase family protein [Pirellulaceae bacterium]